MTRESNLGTLLSEIKTDLVGLINTKIELLKLEALEKTSVAGSFLIYGLIIMNLVFFALLFAFMALGFLIGSWVNSLAGGFGIVTLIYLVILAVLVAWRKSIFTCLQNLFLKELDPELKEEKQL
jgi:hypothetical protein